MAVRMTQAQTKKLQTILKLLETQEVDVVEHATYMLAHFIVVEGYQKR